MIIIAISNYLVQNNIIFWENQGVVSPRDHEAGAVQIKRTMPSNMLEEGNNEEDLKKS